MTGTFWEFSIKLYETPSVSDECLMLQDNYGINVNLLLFCAFVGRDKIALSDEDIEKISLVTKNWHVYVVKPLRDVRRSIKQMLDSGSISEPGATAALRSEVKALELQSEKLEQEWLDGWARINAPQSRGFDAEETVRGNIRLFLALNNAETARSPERLILETLSLHDSVK